MGEVNFYAKVFISTQRKKTLNYNWLAEIQN